MRDEVKKFPKELNYDEAEKNLGLKCLVPYGLRYSVEEIFGG